jgi:integrase
MRVNGKSPFKKTNISVTTVYAACKGANITLSSAQAICNALNLKFLETFISVGKETLSNNTVSHYHRVLNSVLATAVTWQVISENPAKRVSPPKVERHEALYLDDKRAIRLIKLLDDEPIQYRVAIVLLLYSGIRRGELCGLEWNDIDFKHNIISIQRESQYLPGMGIFENSPKSEKSER